MSERGPESDTAAAEHGIQEMLAAPFDVNPIPAEVRAAMLADMPGIVTTAVVNAEPGPPLTYESLIEAMHRLLDAPRKPPPVMPQFLLAHDQPWKWGDPIDLFELVDGAYRRVRAFEPDGDDAYRRVGNAGHVG